MPGRKPECGGPHLRIERQVLEQLASRLESLWPLIASETPKRRAPERQVQSPQLGVATQMRRPERRRSPGPPKPVRPTIRPAWVRRSSLRSAYYLLTSPNWLPEIPCRSGNLRLVVGLNGVQEVASSNLAGPTTSRPSLIISQQLRLRWTTPGYAGARRFLCLLLTMCSLPDGPVPPDLRLVLARTGPEARACQRRRSKFHKDTLVC